MTAARPEPGIDLSELDRDYLVKREVGRGGMGSVYLARHRSAGHDVAIKVIGSKYISDSDALSRFEREARLMARIRHPNIVHQYELRRLRGGHVALVMQYVRGESLVSILRRRGKLRFDEAEQVLRDIGLALEHAHANGVVHRDVKPHNILIDADNGRALLSDFGIAKATQGDAEVTATGIAIGTPAYMAPEQIENTAVDARADIYSLGVVGWEMVGGRRPWEGESLFGIIYKQKHENLPPLTLLRPDTPQNLLLALEGALEKEPGHRWGSASDFVEQLGRDAPTPAMIRRRESAAALLTSGENAVEPPSAGASTIPFRRARQDTPPPVESVADGVAAAAPTATAGSTVRVVTLVAAGVVVGALGVYALSNRSAVTEGAEIVSTADALVGDGADTATTSLPVASSPTHPAAGGAIEPRPASGSRAVRTVGAEASPRPALVERLAPAADSRPSARASVSADGDAVALAREARDANPRVRALTSAAEALLRSRQPEAARRVIDSVLAMRPADPAGYALRARVNVARGDLRAAWADAEVAQRLGDMWGAQTLIALLEGRVGERRAARNRLAALVKRVPARVPYTVKQGTELAVAYVAIGDAKRAVDALLRVRDNGSLGKALSDPAFHSLRSDERFRQLVRVVNPEAP